MASEIKGWDRESLRRLVDALFPEGEGEAGLRLEDVTKVDVAERDAGYEKAFEQASLAVRKHKKLRRKHDEQYRRVYKLLSEPSRPGIPRRWWIYQGWPVVQAFLDLSFEARHSDAAQMLYYATRACDVALETPPESHPPGVVYDLRARAFAELANAFRVSNDYDSADANLERAKDGLDRSSGDPALVARLLVVEASLRIEQRRLSEADRLLERAYRLYLDIGERHLAGRALTQLASVANTDGDPTKAVRLLEEGMALIDRERDPKLIMTSTQALLDYLTFCGEYRRAGELLLESGLGEAFADEPLNLLRLRWVEAKIHAGLDRLDRAEAIFLEIRAGFRERGLEFDAALAGLDLAKVWLRQDQPGRVLPLAVEMVRTFDRMKLPKEGIMALVFVKVACEMEMLTLPALDRARDFMVRLRANPDLKFEIWGTLLG